MRRPARTVRREDRHGPGEPRSHPANKPENVLAAAKTCFAKLGDTALTLADLRVSNPDQLFVPTSLLNEVRRRAAEDAQKALDDDLHSLTTAVMAKVKAWQPEPEAIDQTPSWTSSSTAPSI
ncbi:MAG: DUF3656 domain-containing protein [Lentisphaeria bacterium]